MELSTSFVLFVAGGFKFFFPPNLVKEWEGIGLEGSLGEVLFSIQILFCINLFIL